MSIGFDGLLNLGDAQTPGAFQAVALVQGVAVLDLGDEEDGHILLAFDAKFRLHRVSRSFPWSIPQKK